LWRATDHIEEQIKLAQKIEENGFAYKTKTGLVFDTSKFVDYAKFANLKLDEMESGARVEIDEDKKNPWDFLLWVTNQPSHIMKWNSPWGEGFPGWHLECTAMSSAKLGETFDIHTGGIEHIGVHHTNEIAQGYGAFGHNTANYWMHNAWLTLKEGKMSKSLGNVYTIQDLIKMGFSPMVFRYLVMSSHYRKGLTFSLDSMKAAETALNKLLALKTDKQGIVNEELKKEFVNAISDDLAMPEAMAVVWKTAKSELNEADRWETLLDFDKVLGLELDKEVKEEEIPQEIIDMSNLRVKLKQEKNWAEADHLREEIKKRGYVVEDSQDSCKISRIQ
jgi:cysteinyl-tRNA synthetase